MSQGFDPNAAQAYAGGGYGGGYASGQEEIDLDLGVDTTGGVAGGLVPEGTHLFRVQSYEIQFSNKEYAETMVVLQLIVENSSVPGAVGTSKQEYVSIPGEQRKQNDYIKWAMMMRFLRMKLEAMTGRPWREDNIKLRPRELVGCFFVATVTHDVNSYNDKETGELKTGTQAKLNNWQSVQMMQQQQAEEVVAPNTGNGQPQQTPEPQPAPVVEQSQPAPTVMLPANQNPGTLGPWNPAEEPF